MAASPDALVRLADPFTRELLGEPLSARGWYLCPLPRGGCLALHTLRLGWRCLDVPATWTNSRVDGWRDSSKGGQIYVYSSKAGGGEDHDHNSYRCSAQGGEVLLMVTVPVQKMLNVWSELITNCQRTLCFSVVLCCPWMFC